MDSATLQAALAIRDGLQRSQHRIALAESCTAGRIAATLGILPGISAVLCGSLVVYRNDSKSRWLGISPKILDDPQIGPVSERCSKELALAVLDRTPEADWSLTITGDIGPGAPAETDGMVYCALAGRAEKSTESDPMSYWTRTIHLQCPAPADESDYTARERRIQEATLQALRFANERIAV